MASLVSELVEAGIHFGHRSTHWNPKMEPYIFGKRNKIHIIDVKATIKGLLLARKYLTSTVSGGKDILFVGTKRQARNIIEKHVKECGMHYCTERWLGGTLTNFRTIRERLKRLEELEQLEESGEIDNYSKKMESTLRREKTKILRNLEGIRNMTKLPGVMVIIDVNAEHNAVREARKLGIPTVCLIDTDSDPDFADIPIPGNDDAMRAIEVVVSSLCAAVQEGKQARAQQPDKGEDEKGDGEPKRRRSRRAQFRAEDEAPAGDDDAASSDEGEKPAADGDDKPAAGESTPEASVATEPTKAGPAAVEGDTEKQVTSAVGQEEAAPSDSESAPQEVPSTAAG
jgi:small subunit ribosomal protein S2